VILRNLSGKDQIFQLRPNGKFIEQKTRALKIKMQGMNISTENLLGQSTTQRTRNHHNEPFHVYNTGHLCAPKSQTKGFSVASSLSFESGASDIRILPRALDRNKARESPSAISSKMRQTEMQQIPRLLPSPLWPTKKNMDVSRNNPLLKVRKGLSGTGSSEYSIKSNGMVLI
jgi:hypothetical protein